MSGRSGLGDYLRAANALAGGDSQVRRAIARLLGFDLQIQELQAKASPDTGPGPRRERRKDPQKEEKGGGAADAGAGPVTEMAAQVQGGEDDAWLEPLSPLEVRMPGWMSTVEPIPESRRQTSFPPPRPDPLFEPAWAKALLRSALVVEDEHGPIDVDRAVEFVAAKRQLQKLPRLPVLRLGDAVQVLVDAGPSMAPFVDDQLALLNDIRRIVPLVQELSFEVNPLRAGSPEHWPLPPYCPPAAGSPVLVLSDLGAARGTGTRRAPIQDWLAFAVRVRRAGCMPVALVPFPLIRVHPTLRRALTVVAWERSTTTGQALTARRRARTGS